MKKSFSGRPISFLTVARDEPERVSKFFAMHGFDFPTYVSDDDHVFAAWGVGGVPATAIVLPDGSLHAVTPGDNISADVLESILNGERPRLPGFGRDVNFDWDREDIQWTDGVKPEFLIVIKPTTSTSGGFLYKPGSNRITGDGVPLLNLITTAWQTDFTRLDLRVSDLPTDKFRYVATVPNGRETSLLPALQDAVRHRFGLQVRWEEQEREVLVLKSAKRLDQSSNQELFTVMRGAITLRAQPITRLVGLLPSYTKKIVVDDTGLDGRYDLSLSYRADSPQVLIDELQSKYGLTLEPEKRKVRMLVVARDK